MYPGEVPQRKDSNSKVGQEQFACVSGSGVGVVTESEQHYSWHSFKLVFRHIGDNDVSIW